MTKLGNCDEPAIQTMYENLPDNVKEPILDSLNWTTDYLMRLEGEGHEFFLHANKDQTFCCSFAKPEWGGDHSSRNMPEAPEAVVMAVCEYVNGC